MHDFVARTEHRLTRFINERLRQQLYRDRARVEVTHWEAPDEPVSFAEATAQTFAPFEVGTPWGPPWGTVWFHVTGTVPVGWGKEADTRPELHVDLGFAGGGTGFTCEANAWSAQGTLIKALEPMNRYVTLDAGPGESFELFIEAAANPVVPSFNWYQPTPVGDKATAGTDPIYVVNTLEVALLDTGVWELSQDVDALRGLMLVLPAESTRRHQILSALEDMMDAVDPHDLAGTAARGREVLRPALESPAGRSSHVVHATGHAHIDSAWLWPVRETIRKCSRTFSNVIALMDEDPDLTFACSSAQQYEWVRDHYPELFERIREKVAEGRFVPVGGMWVESDTNMPGSEAMVRQFVLGTRFFIDEFGFEPKDVWLPDSFGYSGAMPQIARAAGKDSFLTQKISWNDTNTFPHHTFWWEGIDGSRIFTHFPPSDTYNSHLSAEELARSERQFREKGRATHALVPFGWGDGGGGPTREMMAAARRKADLEGSPKVVVDTPAEFFAAAKAEHGHLDTWTGEMYLEYHRGTYTSQHRTKAGNRRSEHLLREAELWWTTAVVREGATWPKEQFDRLWKQVLLQQFHDILPGSSIAWVHHEAEQHYGAIAAELEELIAEAGRILLGAGETPFVLNARPFADHGVPALGVAAATEPRIAEVASSGDGFTLSNEALLVELDANGLVTRLFDRRAGRDLLPPGQVSNLLQLHRDIPNEWDAWDINSHYKQVTRDLTEVVSIATVPGGVVIERSTGASSITETVTLDEAGLHLDFDIDWHDRQKLLKLTLPFALHAREATSEIQFGHLARPTSVNTSWDAARFETVAHRWLHVSEPGYGVALANSCTYGYDTLRTTDGDGNSVTTVRPSLLRAPMFPDPDADQGHHQLSFLLVPGAEVGDAVEAGYAENLPTRVLAGAHGVDPLVTIDNPAVVVEAVKLAEDGSGDVVVRLYESRGGRAAAVLGVGFEHGPVVATDLLERPLATGTRSPLVGQDRLELRPFEIVTLRIGRA
ncbi:alpha-mannosidase [Aestuariimicrobium sp. T2.26MG-19.2B]|uniref:alpha-mannosidase n=1 Tax=Aestuariimicrobium sp. T2.26MG-19.2B TaxID=3040679 RepID=UPI0024773783|nr:glycoside hydrolase family 38 C-terminal domain-containing protein [Aestuariimicrobium sp. T2.26MG-19.2B]CAI9405486.1 hypothetical protein AESSP_01422 [Aestuariimicrobium sp. T2.26MG-19.2B]